MSSRVFKARTSHTEENPQLCGLSGRPIRRGDDCFYLTCSGEGANPGRQIFASKKKDGYETGFRVIPSGRTRTIGAGTRWERQVPIYKWQQRDEEGRWHDIKVWEHMVLLSEAVARGYRPPHDAEGGIFCTTARKGSRTKGYGHIVNEQPISALEELAAVMLDSAEPQGEEV